VILEGESEARRIFGARRRRDQSGEGEESGQNQASLKGAGCHGSSSISVQKRISDQYIENVSHLQLS
jgi:hypothetical protein